VTIPLTVGISLLTAASFSPSGTPHQKGIKFTEQPLTPPRPVIKQVRLIAQAANFVVTTS
jgi:hypothetical protein